MRTCSIDGCQGKHYGKGFCRKHYLRARNHGDPSANQRAVRRPVADRFWEKVKKTDGCWIWTGYRNRTGYGEINPGGRASSVLAHRVAYELSSGPIQDGLHVLHRCDNPSCVRPDHLFLGTHLDNMHDMAVKGRGKQLAAGRRGEANGNFRVTDAQVAEIRARSAGGERQAALAKAFGVSKTLIYLIRKGKTRTLPTEASA